jgi:hypothetical protein
MPEPSEPTQLQREANILRDLIGRFRDDSNFLRGHLQARIVYFIDAHDLDSYIAPDKTDSLKGFLFEAEGGATHPEVVAQAAFKSEQILERLLFNGTEPIGLLPSHGEEVQDNVAYYAARYQRETLDLILAAEQEYRRLNQNPIARALLSGISKGTESTSKSLHEASSLLEQFAPALMTYLSKRPRNPRARIRALITDSRLVGLGEFAWERLGLDEPVAQALRSLKPTEEQMFRWRRFLDASDARRERSNNANRIDAEALACMELASGQLRRAGHSHIRIVLVTRVMSLIRATRNLEGLAAAGLSSDSFLRHPRMIFLPGADSKLSAEVINVLDVALNTFEKQLIAQGGEAQKKIDDARQIFVKALHEFERAQFALKLRMEVAPRAADSQSFSGEHVDKLLEWFSDDAKFDAVIREDAAASVRQFGYETFTLGNKDGREPIEAVLRERDSPRRVVTIRPIVAGVPGPVEFTTRELHNQERNCEDLEKLIGDLQAGHSERYLAWSLLHACRNRWDLAKIYAQSAVRVARLEHAESAAVEACLLLAQVHRLSGPEASGDRAEEATKRFSEATRLLHVSGSSTDVRVLQEQAAQVLECCLAVGRVSASPAPPLQGVNALLHAKELGIGQNDELVVARSLGQLLVFVLASQRSEIEWPLKSDPVATAREWHAELCDAMQKVRKTRTTEEIPRRLLAMELIGYQLAREHEVDFIRPPHALSLPNQAADLQGIPEPLRYTASELHLQLSGARDQIGRLITSELERFVGPQDRYRQWELIYAPVWPRNHASSVIASLSGFGKAEELAQLGYSLLSSVIRPTELGVDPAHRRAFARSARRLAGAIEALQREHGLASTDSRVLQLRMDQCYARILLAVVTANPGDKRAAFLELVKDYTKLAADIPESAMVHFRLHVIYSELEELARSDKSRKSDIATDESVEIIEFQHHAHSELESTRELFDRDPFMALLPRHWIHSTIQRRFALTPSREARTIRQNLRKGTAPAGAIEKYCELVKQAFRVQYEGFAYEQAAHEKDEFTRLEFERRTNNLVYMASLFLEAHRDLRELSPHFDATRLEHLITLLSPKGLDAVVNDRIVHTIGFAHHVLGHSTAALVAGERLMRLIFERGLALSARPDIVRIIEDALEWRRGAEFPLKAQAAS